ncbi:MAG TPA: hypothetical protein VMG10_25505 [Gemmataceae bacterium]|nr:hypothetical protein [Gemmataceae bacterium]
MSLSSSCLPAAPSIPSQPAQLGGTVLPALMLAAIYAVPLVVALRPVADPVVDPDIWWHLRVGQWVSEHHAVPVTDPFSRYGADKPWLAYSWLYEVLVYQLYEAFGLAGIVAYRVALSLAVAAALHRLIRRREPSFLAATGLTAVAALAMAPLFSERPWLFTILFTTLTLDVVLDLRQGRAGRGMWLLPIVYVLWGNLHIQFVYGLFVLGLACVMPEFVDCGVVPSRKRLFGLTALCLAATLVNPYHVQLYRVVMEYATQSGPFRCVNELRAMEFRETPDWVVLLLGAAAVFALGRRRRVSIFEVLLLASAAVFAFRSRRDLWFLVLASSPILAVSDASQKRRCPPRFCEASLTVKMATAALLAVLLGLLAWQRDLSEETLRRKVAGVFPVEATAVIAEHGYPGPLFNDFNWGGFLIWSLPQLPVVLDGRTNLHGDERMLRIGNTWAAGPGWRSDPDLASAEVVLADAQSPLGCVLVLDDRFELVHEDAIARVFIRKRPGGSVSDHCAETGTP